MVETKDEAASRRFIAAVARLARKSLGSDASVVPLQAPGGGDGVTLRTPDLTQPIHLFQRDGKVVLAYGDAAATTRSTRARSSATPSSTRTRAQALGGDYDLSFYLGFEPILQLVDSTGAGDDEGWLKVKPYLEPLGALVVGAQRDGDKLRSAFGITVR